MTCLGHEANAQHGGWAALSGGGAPRNSPRRRMRRSTADVTASVLCSAPSSFLRRGYRRAVEWANGQRRRRMGGVMTIAIAQNRQQFGEGGEGHAEGGSDSRRRNEGSAIDGDE